MVYRLLKIQHVTDIIKSSLFNENKNGVFMREKKEYRSAIRSRKLIRQAFMELLKEKEFEKITVTDIVKRADINRSTFYAHYPDVFGVIDEIQQEVLDYTQKVLEEINFNNFFQNPKPILKKIVKIAEDNHELYRLLSSSSMLVKQLQKLKMLLIERTIKTIEVSPQYADSFEFEFMVRFFMGGVVDVYTQWLNGDIDTSLEELTNQLANMITRTMKDTRGM